MKAAGAQGDENTIREVMAKNAKRGCIGELIGGKIKEKVGGGGRYPSKRSKSETNIIETRGSDKMNTVRRDKGGEGERREGLYKSSLTALKRNAVV